MPAYYLGVPPDCLLLINFLSGQTADPRVMLFSNVNPGSLFGLYLPACAATDPGMLPAAYYLNTCSAAQNPCVVYRTNREDAGLRAHAWETNQ